MQHHHNPKLMDCDYSKLFYAKHSGIGTGTITSPWTPVSAGPTGPLGSADTNGGMDSKHLVDVGDMSDDEKDLSSADAEGVWSPDIEQSFQEALAIYPPCGRRKIILSDEGKMYGRNELIARYIKLRTGKTRTRKQVSSHIQVLARRKLREIQAKLKVDLNSGMNKNIMPTISCMTNDGLLSIAGGQTGLHHFRNVDGQILSTIDYYHQHHSSMLPCHSMHPVDTIAPNVQLMANVLHKTGQFWQPGLQPSTSQDIKPFVQSPYGAGKPATAVSGDIDSGLPSAQVPWEGRAIATHKFRVLEFTAFMEVPRDDNMVGLDNGNYHRHLFVHIGGKPTYADPLLESVEIKQISDKFPEKSGGLKDLYDKGPQNAFYLVKCWADLNTNIDETNAFYGVTSQYESNENVVITCSTKVCSFGKQVVEKVETEYSRLENSRFYYRIQRSPMCEYMINFIQKLKHLPERYMMNSVLENFTILQVISNKETQETLLCIAYVFEVAASNCGTQHHIYRLIKE